MAVQIAFAWTSGPAMVSSPLVAVGWRSCRLGAVEPITTTFPRSCARGTRPATRSANDTVGNVPGPPRKSIHASPASNADAGSVAPVARRAATTATLSSRLIRAG